MSNVSNCSVCHKIFLKGIRDICPACLKKEEQELNVIRKFLRKNKNASVLETSTETKISVDQIYHYIRDKRLIVVDMPNMGYPCRKCGNSIQKGSLCPSCNKELTELANALKDGQDISSTNKIEQTYHINK